MNNALPFWLATIAFILLSGVFAEFGSLGMTLSCIICASFCALIWADSW